MASLLHRRRPSPRPAASVAAAHAVADAHLVARAQADRAAFAAPYDRHFAGVYGYCYRELGSAERAEDAAQQVFAQALGSLPRYREQGRFRSWLYAIAHHVIAAQRRADRADASLDALPEVADARASPEDQALGSLARGDLLAAVARLPADQRRVVALRIAGLKGREIAEVLGRSHEAVRMLQHRALARLGASLVPPRGGRDDA